MAVEREFLVQPEKFPTFKDWLRYGGKEYFPKGNLTGLWPTLKAYPDYPFLDQAVNRPKSPSIAPPKILSSLNYNDF